MNKYEILFVVSEGFDTCIDGGVFTSGRPDDVSANMEKRIEDLAEIFTVEVSGMAGVVGEHKVGNLSSVNKYGAYIKYSPTDAQSRENVKREIEVTKGFWKPMQVHLNRLRELDGHRPGFTEIRNGAAGNDDEHFYFIENPTEYRLINHLRKRRIEQTVALEITDHGTFEIPASQSRSFFRQTADMQFVIKVEDVSSKNCEATCLLGTDQRLQLKFSQDHHTAILDARRDPKLLDVVVHPEIQYHLGVAKKTNKYNLIRIDGSVQKSI